MKDAFAAAPFECGVIHDSTAVATSNGAAHFQRIQSHACITVGHIYNCGQRCVVDSHGAIETARICERVPQKQLHRRR